MDRDFIFFCAKADLSILKDNIIWYRSNWDYEEAIMYAKKMLETILNNLNKL